MRIEFLGVSGSGKTFMAERLYPEIKKKYPDICWPSKYLYQNHSHVARNIIKLFYVTIFTLFHLRWVLKLLSVISKTVAGNFSQCCILFFNGTYLKHEIERNKNIVTIFDEGVAQFIWALCLRNRKMLQKDEFQSVIQLFGCPEIIYVICASPRTIAMRIRERGRRVYIQKADDMESAIKCMQEIQNGIIEYFTDLCQAINVVIIENEN